MIFMAKRKRGRKRTLTEKQRKENALLSNEKWRKGHTKIINMRFNTEADKDILEKLNKTLNKTDYIRSLIRADIKRG